MLARHSVPAVRAAGGVVWRPGDAEVEVCLVHRPRYDDWSLPKGKLEDGEHPLVAAVREVAEEADVLAVPQVRLMQTRYLTREGVPKTVDYWSMRAAGTGGFQVHTEVDAIRWLPLREAFQAVSYAHDVTVLRKFAALPPVTAVLALLCGGEFGSLDTAARRAATGFVQTLAPVLRLIRPQRLLSAGHPHDGLEPLAELLSLPIEVDTGLETAPDAREEPAARIAALAAGGVAAVVWVRDAPVSGLLDRLGGTGPFADRANGWLLAFHGKRLVAADPLT